MKKFSFSSPIENLNISLKYIKKLKKLKIHKISDLLFHFPHRYEDFSCLSKIKDLKLLKPCSIFGKIIEVQSKKSYFKKITITQALINDLTGTVRALWFGKPYLKNYLKKGDKVFLAGKPILGENGIYFQNPEYEKIKYKNPSGFKLIHTARIAPIYPQTTGLSSKIIRSLIASLLIKFKNKLPETLPSQIIKEKKLLSLSEALFQIHFPKTLKIAEKAKRRFQFEEIFLVQLFVLREKIKIAREKAFSIPIDEDLLKKFSQSLPFSLTNAQKKACWQILKDLEKPKPMNRLLEGEVGSGKTVVATLATLCVIKAGYQVAFMAPTEILAKQHFQEISKLLENFRINIGLLTGKEDKFISKNLKKQAIEISRKNLFKKTLEGKIDLLIGTHALIEDKVKFANLALVILDEQHRFGVEQRAKLLKTGKSQDLKIPHLLSMTATPIPRTLALTIYGDLDLSIVDELPKGRKKIITQVVPPEEKQEVYNFIKKEIKKGRQVFVICPRIEKSQNSNSEFQRKDILSWKEAKTVKEEYEKLSKKIFPDLKIGMLHGKMKTKEKEEVMRNFKSKKIDVLVSTSVVEVGIDVPNATVMIIEGAERFGLAQLHQFRGRVGRSKFQSYCFLFSDSLSESSKKRLRALIKSENGFELAEKDLKIRGPGDFFGTRQWGMPDLAMAGLKDIKLAQETREAAWQILKKDPNLKNYPQLKARLTKFKTQVHRE
jgi:ATP-dependent DNA helicase RecG